LPKDAGGFGDGQQLKRDIRGGFRCSHAVSVYRRRGAEHAFRAPLLQLLSPDRGDEG